MKKRLRKVVELSVRMVIWLFFFSFWFVRFVVSWLMCCWKFVKLMVLLVLVISVVRLLWVLVL